MLLQKLFGKKKPKEEQEWEELLVEDVKAPPAKELSKEVLGAFSGKLNPLETKSILESFTAQGWEEVKPYMVKMATGRIPVVVWVLECLFGAYPQESAALILPHEKEMPVKNRLALFFAVGKGNEDVVTQGILRDFKTMAEEDMGSSLRILALYPTKEGMDAIASLLNHEDWRMVMKAASALNEAKAKDYLPQLKELCNEKGILGEGISKIVKEMEQ